MCRPRIPSFAGTLLSGLHTSPDIILSSGSSACCLRLGVTGKMSIPPTMLMSQWASLGTRGNDELLCEQPGPPPSYRWGAACNATETIFANPKSDVFGPYFDNDGGMCVPYVGEFWFVAVCVARQCFLSEVTVRSDAVFHGKNVFLNQKTTMAYTVSVLGPAAQLGGNVRVVLLCYVVD